MTKLEFAEKLENYEKQQQRSKRLYFLIGVVCLILVFVPEVALFLDASMFGFTSVMLSIFGGIFLGKAWQIQSGTEEKELLINALELLSSANET
tara:strand:- start:5161 stop:5442 length:282 start_codon:yes stop_codon:yes gene_type:complete